MFIVGTQLADLDESAPDFVSVRGDDPMALVRTPMLRMEKPECPVSGLVSAAKQVSQGLRISLFPLQSGSYLSVPRVAMAMREEAGEPQAQRRLQ